VHIALSILVVLMSFGTSQGAARGFRWWLDVNIRRELALTAEQAAAIEAEFGRTLQHRRVLRSKFDAANAQLTRAFARGDLSDAEADALVTRVEDLRRQRNVARRQLLVAMYFLLTPSQRARLPGLVEKTSAIIPAPC
jgi:Spy/CpxP family protein refolding chaperone